MNFEINKPYKISDGIEITVKQNKKVEVVVNGVNSYVYLNITAALKTLAEFSEYGDEEYLIVDSEKSIINYFPKTLTRTTKQKTILISDIHSISYDEKHFWYWPESKRVEINSFKEDLSGIPKNILGLLASLRCVSFYEDKGELKLNIVNDANLLVAIQELEEVLGGSILDERCRVRFYKGEKHGNIEIYMNYHGALFKFVDDYEFIKATVHGISVDNFTKINNEDEEE